MTESLVDQFKEDFGLLIEAGFLAVKQLHEKRATALFQAARVLNPESSAPDLGFGYIALNKLETEKSAKIFRDILDKEPEHHLAQTFLGMSYLLHKEKRPEGERLIKEAMEATDDPTIVHLGKTALNWADKDLKNKKAPFFSDD